MTDPVFSHRYGQRPLIDVPAMQVTSSPQLAITSLQKPVAVYQPPPPAPPNITTHPVVPRAYHTAPPADPFHYHHYDPYSRSRQFIGPNGELVKPLETYFDAKYQYPGVIYPSPPPRPPTPPVIISPPPPPHPPPPPPPPPQAPVAYPLPPPNPHYRIHPPIYSTHVPQDFDVNCDLEYGRVVKISVRESRGHFRGIPEYLRRELLKGYGRYPFIKVKIKSHNGDFHIFANHKSTRRRNDRYDDRSRDRFYEDRPRDRFYEDRPRDRFYQDPEDEDEYWRRMDSDRATVL